MGIFPCHFPFPSPIPCQTLKETEEKHEEQEYDQSNNSSSLLSQPSLPSVPSLTPLQPTQPSSHHHYHRSLAATLKGHTSYVFSVVLGTKYLYSGSSDGQIRRWSRHPTTITNNQNGCVVAEVHNGVKSMVVFGDKLFTAHHDHKIRVWKIEEKNRDDYSSSSAAAAHYRCIATLPTLNERCSKLFNPKNYVEIRRHKKSTWVHHVDAVSALALSKDKELLYSVSWDRTFKVWRTSDFKCLESVMNAHDDAINAIVVSDDGFVYTGSADKKMKVWKKKSIEQEKTGEERKNNNNNKKKKFKHSLVATLEKHKSAVNALALSKDGSVLYSGACDRSIIVWEKEDGGGMVVSGALRGHGKSILCLVVVEDLVVSGSADKTVRVWKRGNIGRSYCCLAVFEGHKSPVKCLTAAAMDDSDSKKDGFSGNSYVVYSGSLDFDIKVWNFYVPSHVHT